MVREGLVRLRRDQVVALEPHAPDAGHVEARFERDHVASLERLGALGNQVRGLGMPQPQPVAGMRREVVPPGRATAKWPRTAASICLAGMPGRSSDSPASIAPMQISNSSFCRGVGSPPTTKVFVKSAR